MLAADLNGLPEGSILQTIKICAVCEGVLSVADKPATPDLGNEVQKATCPLFPLDELGDIKTT